MTSIGNKSKVSIVRVDNMTYSFAGSNKGGIRHVARALTFLNPDPFAYSHRIRKFDKKSRKFQIGMLKILETYLKENGVEYEVEDYAYALPEGIEIDDRMTGKYIHQSHAVRRFFERRFGIIVVPTRGGKTFIAAEIMRIFLATDEGNFLFVTDNRTLFSQAINDFRTFYEPRYGELRIGEIREGKIDVTERVTVGMIQTIQSTLSNRCKDAVKKRTLEKYLKELKFLAVDEIHENASDSKLKIYRKCKKLEYQLCLSATPYRSGALVQNLKLREWSGDVVYEISEKTLKERGVLSDYRVFMLVVNHNDIEYSVAQDDYELYRKELIFNSAYRNGVLRRVIDILQRLNLKTLLLFQSIEHGKRVERLTGIPFISGETSNEDRERAKTEFLNATGGMLSASGIFKKGVTLPSVEVMINIDGGLEDANTIQRKGRVLGTTDTKDRSLILDFFDEFDAYFTDHSASRLQTYVDAIGERNVGILDTEVDDCYETLERWIRKWFRL